MALLSRDRLKRTKRELGERQEGEAEKLELKRYR